MALTQISTNGVKNNTLTSDDIASSAITVSELAVDAVEDDRIKTSNSPSAGKFLQYKDASDKLTWTTVESDKIEEGNTSIETVDTGSDGHVKITTEGTERLRIHSNGNVTVGTSTDSANKLTVYGTNSSLVIQNSATGSGSDNGFYIGNGNGTIAYLWNYENESLRFATNDTERFRIGAAGQLGVGGATYGSSGQVLTSGGASAAPSWTTISAAPEITATASGAIAAGKPVSINSNGTASPIVATFTAVNPPTLVHQEENDNTFNDAGLEACYDAGNDRWFVGVKFDHPSYNNRWGFRVYQDKIDSGTWNLGNNGAWDAITSNGMGSGKMVLAAKGKPIFFYRDSETLRAQIGTYNSTDEDISWSTVRRSDNNSDALHSMREQFDVARIADNKFAIIVQNASGTPQNTCSCIIATFSGTTITMASETMVSTSDISQQNPRIMWDSTNSRLVAFYGQSSAGKLRTATLSGNTQTWGTESGSLGVIYQPSNIAYDESADRYIICFYNSSNQGCYRLGTRSGNNMSVSSSYTFQSTSAVSNLAVAYNPEIERIGIAYNHTPSGQSGKIRQGKIDTTANPPITFGSDYSFGSGEQQHIKLFYSTVFKEFFGMWQKSANNGKNQAARWNVGSLSSTSNSYVGFVDSAVSDGNTATIKVSGNTTTGQSGLTTGTKYYIKRNGSLGTTAETPEVVAGVALSATNLLIQ